MLIHYAGWTDKLAPVLGGINPVAAPFLSFSLPEPTGVVGVVAPDAPPLLGLVAELAPALAPATRSSRSCRRPQPLPGLDLAEVLGVSDVPGGVVNLLSGRRHELGHRARRPPRPERDRRRRGRRRAVGELDRLAAETIKRARHRDRRPSYEEAVADALERLEAVTELKTAWHPVGALASPLVEAVALAVAAPASALYGFSLPSLTPGRHATNRQPRASIEPTRLAVVVVFEGVAVHDYSEMAAAIGHCADNVVARRVPDVFLRPCR